MITEKSTPKEILETFNKWEEMAILNFFFKNGIKSKKQFLTKPIKKASVTYISPEGDKWIVFHLRGYKTPIPILCIDTVSYMSVYISVMFSPEEKGYYYFTPHFFQRLVERNKLTDTKKEIIGKLLYEAIALVQDLQLPREGYSNIEINVPTNLGRFLGHTYIQDDVIIIQYNTCILDETISYSKKNKYKKIDNMYKNMREEFQEITKDLANGKFPSQFE